MAELDFINLYNEALNPRLQNRNFVFVAFCSEYVKKIEALVYPDWYAACFMRECRNSSVWVPVAHRLSFGSQLGVLRKPLLWWNLVLQVVLTAAVFSIYAYMAEYLKVVTGMDVRSISLMLFLFGTAGFFGTLAAGWFMGLHLSGTASGFMALFAPTLFLIFLFAQSYAVAVVLVVLWGFVHAAAIPLCQALVLRAAPEAPEFSNSLFNSFGNLGLMGGTMIGGLFIVSFGIRVLPLASIALLAVAALIFLLERRFYARREAMP